VTLIQRILTAHGLPATRARACAGALSVGLGVACAAGAFSDERRIDALVDAERSLSAAARERGAPSACLDASTGDAVTFAPGPAKAARVWRERLSDDAGRDWFPTLVELSGWEDLGFSIGAWRSVPSSADAGHYLRVWRKDKSGEWKIALDAAGPHSPSDHGASEVTIEGAYHAAPDTNEWRKGPPAGGNIGSGGLWVGGGAMSWGLGFGIGNDYVAYHSRIEYENERNAHERHQLMTAERTLGWAVRKDGWSRGYEGVASSDLRFLRDGATPTVGPEAAARASASRPRNVDWVHRGSAVAKSWDLGYSYGLAIERRKGSSRPDTSAFVHLWRKDEEHRWRLMADWESAFRKR
jgi:ketosteroid isomerase-like protein